MKSVVVTGASSGIGKATALHLANSGWTVFPVVRDAEDANSLSEEHQSLEPIRFDVTNGEEIESGASQVAKRLGRHKLSGLVNNAGIAKLGPLALQDIDEFIAHFSVNTFGVLRVTQAFLPLLGMDTSRAGQPGRIINMTSVGGELASPFLGAYTASKHAVESITDSLRRELIIYDIDAIAIGPGSVKTPIWRKAREHHKDGPYADSRWHDSLNRFLSKMVEGGESGLDPARIAETVLAALTEKHPKARYAPVPNKLRNYVLPTVLPKRWVDKGFWKHFGIHA